jgi:hypothetical protein
VQVYSFKLIVHVCLVTLCTVSCLYSILINCAYIQADTKMLFEYISVIPDVIPSQKTDSISSSSNLYLGVREYGDIVRTYS